MPSDTCDANVLDAGEKLLWQGEPDPERIRAKRRTFQWLMVGGEALIVLVGLAIWVYEYGSLGGATQRLQEIRSVDQLLQNPFDLLPFILVLYLPLGVAVGWWAMSTILIVRYTITDRRVIIQSGKGRKVTAELRREEFPTFAVEDNNGLTNIWFASAGSPGRRKDAPTLSDLPNGSALVLLLVQRLGFQRG